MTKSYFSDNKPYYSINEYCKKTFGGKIYRLSLNGGCSCPNRDGTLGTGGCAFCSEGGSGDFAPSSFLTVAEQIQQAKERISRKTDCTGYIAYFQAYTGTYGPTELLRQQFTQAINRPDIVALSIGTRSDCLSGEILDLLEELSHIKPVWIELGLQTIHHSTHKQMNTHTTVEQYDKAFRELSQRGISVITHVILGLPGESKEMMLETISHVSELARNTPASPFAHFGIKIQLLHVLKGTALARRYEKEPFEIFELEDYCDFVADCLELLPPEMVIHRLTGDGPRKLLIAPLWSTDKKRVLNTIHRKLRERNTNGESAYFNS